MTNAQSTLYEYDMMMEYVDFNNQLYPFLGKEFNNLIKEWDDLPDFLWSINKEQHPLRMRDAEVVIDWGMILFRYVNMVRGQGGTCVLENSYLFNKRKAQGKKNLQVVETRSNIGDKKNKIDSLFHYFIKYEENGVEMMEDCSNGKYFKMRYEDYKELGSYCENKEWVCLNGSRCNDERAERSMKASVFNCKKANADNKVMFGDIKPKILAQRILNL